MFEARKRGPKPTSTYHPRMTGLESHMEEEIARQAHRTNETRKQTQPTRKRGRKTPRFPEYENDRKTEEAMQLVSLQNRCWRTPSEIARRQHVLQSALALGWLLFFFALTLPVCAQDPACPPCLAKRVVIDKTQQVLRAYEGDQIVLESRVSTGRWDRSTPNGTFEAGEKHRMHYSKLYHNAPMPFSVHVTGQVFIHGYTEVPPRPASHGCIRLPLTGDNPAKRFFEWIDPGTMIEIIGHWERG